MRRIDQLRSERRGRGSAQVPAQKLETIGLVLIVILILAFTISRSWHYIHWSAR